MKTITIEIPDHVELPFTGSEEELAQEVRTAAAIQWYQQELISQGRAAEIADLSRADFPDALYRAKVPACQVSIEELKEELESWQRLSGESSTPRR
jgi:predicted HTH domain antitoxin